MQLAIWVLHRSYIDLASLWASSPTPCDVELGPQEFSPWVEHVCRQGEL